MLAQEAAHIGLWDWDLRTNAHTVFGEYLQLYGLPADPFPHLRGMARTDSSGRP